MIVLGLLAAGLFIALALYLRLVQANLWTPNPAGGLGAAGAAGVPAAQVQQAVRAMDLVAVRLDTSVRAESGDESWRGDVRASVRADARLYFGVDLSRVRIDALRAGEWIKAYRVIVPEPRRIATEVLRERESPDVRVGWLRLRSRAGEYHLGLARQGLADAARDLRLTPEDEAMVREQTRQRVADLVRAIAGEAAQVMVEFREPSPDSPDLLPEGQAADLGRGSQGRPAPAAAAGGEGGAGGWGWGGLANVNTGESASPVGR
jgi:hypothetical protein